MEEQEAKKVLIIGAGPAGLATAYQLLKSSGIKPIIVEQEDQVGGISKTINHHGYLLDIGPHRFFSKSERVNNFWLEILDSDNFFAVKRLTRIFYLKKFFDYPINLSLSVMANLGFFRTVKIGFSYIWSRIRQIQPQKSLADFYINRFGKELYKTFFEDYTRKVWGVPCEQIPADWGSQRVRGLSITKVIGHAMMNIFGKNKNSETSLIEKFNYPKFGAGQMYRGVADLIQKMGGKIMLKQEVVGMSFADGKVSSVKMKNLENDELWDFKPDCIVSSMPVKELISAFGSDVPQEIQGIASGLIYRDYIIVGLLFAKMCLENEKNILPDNWIYIQEREAKMGRLDIFNNFSSKMLKDENNVWLGGEYFCNENDEFWSKSDSEIKDFAVKELERMNMTSSQDLLDYVVIRQKKAYPAYFGSYGRFSELRNYLDGFENLYLIGRNGMHKYNNMDHSVLSGLVSADNIVNNIKSKDNIWGINTDDEYHEDDKNT